MSDFQTLLDNYNYLKLCRLLREETIHPKSNLATHVESGKWTSDSCTAAILDGNMRVLRILYENGIALNESCYVEAARLGYDDIFGFILGRCPISSKTMEKISQVTSDENYLKVLECIKTVHKYSFLSS
jgi:hypothetical protein